MWDTKHLRTNRPSVSDLLPWAMLVESGIVQTKKGAFIAAFFANPPDADSLTTEYAMSVSETLNRALSRMGDGWTIWTDVISTPSEDYPTPELSHFPDNLSRAVDEERRRAFRREGAHFENERVFAICYTPPLLHVSKLQTLMYEDTIDNERSILRRVLAGFKGEVDKFQDMVENVMVGNSKLRGAGLQRMRTYKWEIDGQSHEVDQLVNYLNYCATGKYQALFLPKDGCFLDIMIGTRDFWVGEIPLFGDEYITCVAIDGFPIKHTPNITRALNTLDMPYRFTQRYIAMDMATADKQINKLRKRWGQKVRGIQTELLKMKVGSTDKYAEDMNLESEMLQAIAKSGQVSFGWYTAVVVLRDTDPLVLRERARAVERTINACGFGARIEGTNTTEAWRGSLPGDTECNIRRPMVHSYELSDFLPLSGVWTGHREAPCPFYPTGSPPLLFAKTIGAIPFRLNVHVHDVGHTLIFGPSGMGKSSLLNTIAMQCLRYPDIKIWAFDYKFGMFGTVHACGGTHYELAGGDTPQLCPLSDLDTPEQKAWGQEYVEILYNLNSNEKLESEQRVEIRNAIVRMADEGRRSMTDFCLIVQDKKVRSAVSFYTNEGPAGFLLDARKDNVRAGRFNVFETLSLAPLGNKVMLPVLLSLFRKFEQGLDGTPHFLFLDEAWLALGDPVWAHKLHDWLRLLRAKNCAVIMATQSLSDVAESKLVTVIKEQVPTKIYLPNPQAEDEHSKAFYASFGLNTNQIRIIREAVMKRDYYVTSPEGNRLISLDMGPLLKCWATATSEPHVKRFRKLMKEHGHDWKNVHMEESGVHIDDLLRTEHRSYIWRPGLVNETTTG